MKELFKSQSFYPAWVVNFKLARRIRVDTFLDTRDPEVYVDGAFRWDSTKEGYSYWLKAYRYWAEER